MSQQELFLSEETYSSKWYIFKNLEIGKLYAKIPWDDLSTCLPDQQAGRGAPRWLSNQGMLALMFLKHYLNVSDKQLIDRLNTDWSLQIFCGKLLRDNEQIRDTNLPSSTRSYLGEHLELEALQATLLSHWKQDIENSHVLLMDATCYESYIRFPTDVKLLWESNVWVYEKLLFKLCRLTATKRPRNKYLDQKRKQLNYDRLRRKSYKKGRVRRRSLLYLLEKGIAHLQELLNTHTELVLTSAQYNHLRTIKKVLIQQKYLFDHPQNKVKDRIVSLYKPYLRPIVRGKENKPVEFGMKAHMLQSGGITYFDSINFDAYNECKRLKISIIKHQQYFGSVHQLSADRIYPTNENRRFISKKEVFTNFAPKGRNRLTKAEKVLKAELNKQRSTSLEGSFGNHKNHYGLRKVKAIGCSNEKIWVFFGVMTANAKYLAIKEQSPPIQAAA